MIKLYCRAMPPPRSNRLTRLLRLADDAAATHMVELLLTDPESRTLLDSNVLAQVFGSIVKKLAENRPIRIFFPRWHRAEIKRKLKKLQLQMSEENRLLWTDASSQKPRHLTQILEATSFSDSYADVGSNALFPDLDSLFERIKERYFVARFHLYDEHMRIFSEFVSVETVKKAAGEVGEETGWQMFVM